jgi:RNA polymerase sigma-70 factor (ECF subfamily)
MRVAPLPERATYDAVPDAPATDDRLALLFACCHPALAPDARLALTLRAVVGMTTPQIARAFLVNERTLAQRIVRAKRKIVTAGIALTVPADDVLAERLSDVLAVVALMYNEGFVSSDGPTQDRDLAGDAVWLAGVVATSLPREAEAWGLAALLTFQHARAAARFSDAGELVLLPDQDRSRWDHTAIAAAEEMLDRAAALQAPGPYQLRAAIAACHATGPSWEETDWLQIVTLFDLLARHDPSPVVRLNRAVALSRLGPAYVEQALADVDALADGLDGYHLFHATRAELLTALGRADEADAANARALALTGNDAERRLLATRLHRRPLDDGS